MKLVGASCAAGDLSMNSKCYRKFDRQLSWYDASNDCLSRGESLAVFTNIGRPSDNRQLTDWLNRDKSYWIGLVRSWWKTTDRGDFLTIFCTITRCRPDGRLGRCFVIDNHPQIGILAHFVVQVAVSLW